MATLCRIATPSRPSTILALTPPKILYYPQSMYFQFFFHPIGPEFECGSLET